MCKTLVIISDLHSGSVFGLCPPGYWEADDDRRSMQKEAWQAYMKIVNRWKKPDILLVNGDCIEGTAKKDGGAELTTLDRNIQCEMAVKSISQFQAGQILMTYGTKYHTGDQAEDFEYNIAQDLGAKIGGRIDFEIDGLIFNARHKIGGSSIFNGRASAIMREMAWSLINESVDNSPKVRVIIRSHVHYHIWIEQGDRVMFTTPCLQLSRGRYGSRECSGETHWGAIRLTISKGTIIKKEVELCRLRSNAPRLMKLT